MSRSLIYPEIYYYVIYLRLIKINLEIVCIHVHRILRPNYFFLMNKNNSDFAYINCFNGSPHFAIDTDKYSHFVNGCT